MIKRKFQESYNLDLDGTDFNAGTQLPIAGIETVPKICPECPECTEIIFTDISLVEGDFNPNFAERLFIWDIGNNLIDLELICKLKKYVVLYEITSFNGETTEFVASGMFVESGFQNGLQAYLNYENFFLMYDGVDYPVPRSEESGYKYDLTVTFHRTYEIVEDPPETFTIIPNDPDPAIFFLQI